MFEVRIGNGANLSAGCKAPITWIPKKLRAEFQELEHNTFNNFDDAYEFADNACDLLLKARLDPRTKSQVFFLKFPVQIYRDGDKIKGYSVEPSLSELSFEELGTLRSWIFEKINNEQSWIVEDPEEYAEEHYGYILKEGNPSGIYWGNITRQGEFDKRLNDLCKRNQAHHKQIQKLTKKLDEVIALLKSKTKQK